MANPDKIFEDVLLALTGFVAGAIIVSTLTRTPSESLPEPRKIEWLEEHEPSGANMSSSWSLDPKIQELLR